MRQLVFIAAHKIGQSLERMHEGTYCWLVFHFIVYISVAGPSFESKSEARYLKTIGCDAVVIFI